MVVIGRLGRRLLGLLGLRLSLSLLLELIGQLILGLIVLLELLQLLHIRLMCGLLHRLLIDLGPIQVLGPWRLVVMSLRGKKGAGGYGHSEHAMG